MSAYGILYLLPVPISDESGLQHIPAHNISIVSSLRCFIAEDAKTARANLKKLSYPNIAQAEIHLLNEHTASSEHGALLELLKKGDVGLMSDAGCPGIADPGADIVRLAHSRSIRVVPLSGPSSIVLSVMASGFNGQNFAFVGYLPVDKTQRNRRINELEQLSSRQAQFFIETPYRNQQLLGSLLEQLHPDTLLFIGQHITSSGEQLKSLAVAEWKKRKTELPKVPVVYGIYRQG